MTLSLCLCAKIMSLSLYPSNLLSHCSSLSFSRIHTISIYLSIYLSISPIHYPPPPQPRPHLTPPSLSSLPFHPLDKFSIFRVWISLVQKDVMPDYAYTGLWWQISLKNKRSKSQHVLYRICWHTLWIIYQPHTGKGLYVQSIVRDW